MKSWENLISMLKTSQDMVDGEKITGNLGLPFTHFSKKSLTRKRCWIVTKK